MEEMICKKTIFLNHNNPLKTEDIKDWIAKKGKIQPKILMYKLNSLFLNTKWLNGSENKTICIPKKIDTKIKSQKKVETTAETSFSSSLFSTNNFINDWEKPLVDNDFERVVKFLKLPVRAIPGDPKLTEITVNETIPNTKFTITEREFSESTFNSVFFFIKFSTINLW